MKINQLKLIALMPLLVFASCKNQPKEEPLSPFNQELVTVTDSISSLMAQYHYNPAELDETEYLKIEDQVKALAKTAETQKEFIDGFNTIWREGPFSHVRLDVMQQSAADMANFVDSMRVGEQAVQLEYEGQTAILTVNTMMGTDTIERIFAAYKEISEKGSETLIIDLRNNEGGAFAIVPLIGHVIAEDTEAGIFVARKWWASNTEAPVAADVQALEPWRGWSIKAFWRDVQQEAALRVNFEAMSPRFEGRVYVLTSKITASAAEFATDALANAEQVTLIGETTAGEMLSQTMFDLPSGLQLSLPIAEYYSVRMGRIEGKGVQPDIEVNKDNAKDVALGLIAGKTKEEVLSQLESR